MEAITNTTYSCVVSSPSRFSPRTRLETFSLIGKMSPDGSASCLWPESNSLVRRDRKHLVGVVQYFPSERPGAIESHCIEISQPRQSSTEGGGTCLQYTRFGCEPTASAAGRMNLHHPFFFLLSVLIFTEGTSRISHRSNTWIQTKIISATSSGPAAALLRLADHFRVRSKGIGSERAGRHLLMLVEEPYFGPLQHDSCRMR